MHLIWLIPIITTIVCLFLILIFCCNCVCVNEEALWSMIVSDRRNRDPVIRDTITAPAVVFSRQPDITRNQNNFRQDRGNMTIV